MIEADTSENLAPMIEIAPIETKNSAFKELSVCAVCKVTY